MAALMEMFQNIFAKLGFGDVATIFEEIKAAIAKIFNKDAE